MTQEGEVGHGPALTDFVKWCNNHFLELKVLKTKNFINFKGLQVETVGCYKYLSTIIDKDLNYDLNTSAICKKGIQRLSYLLIVLFYKSFIESILTFCIVF